MSGPFDQLKAGSGSLPGASRWPLMHRLIVYICSVYVKGSFAQGNSGNGLTQRRIF